MSFHSDIPLDKSSSKPDELQLNNRPSNIGDAQLDLKKEFNKFAAIIENGNTASPENIDFWIDLSEESAELYLETFTPTEFSNLITVFLSEILKNSNYKYPCLVILVKWILNLRQPFFDKFGFDIFTQISPIIETLENEFHNNPDNELLSAINMLRIQMI